MFSRIKCRASLGLVSGKVSQYNTLNNWTCEVQELSPRQGTQKYNKMISPTLKRRKTK